MSTETTLHALQHGAHFSEAPLAGRDGMPLIPAETGVYLGA